jgi:3-oxoacyl-[acyl-carrier-protein] synthase-3
MNDATVVFHSYAKALGSRRITNDDLARQIDTSDEWIQQRTGIRTRYWVEPGVGSSDLAAEAARKTLQQAGNPPVDCIIAGTLSPDHYFPGIGVLLQNKLGLPSVPAYDIRLQCSGFLYGMEMAAALIRAGQYQRILLVGAEVHSTGLDISTRGRDVAVLFGDGGGAVLVERAATAPRGAMLFEFLGSELHSDGAFAGELWCQYPGSLHFTHAITPDEFAAGETFPKMNGRKVFEHAVRSMTEVSHSLLAKLGLDSSQVSLFVPHQANLRINQLVGESLKLSSNQVFNTIERYGNTTAATIPIGMTDAVGEGKIAEDSLILHAAFGSGFTWGAVAVRATQRS